MRLWTLHPKYLDPQGLVALWREALLAKAVLRGETRGYRHHPQLLRFQAHAAPRSAINAYLAAIHDEASERGYSFDDYYPGYRTGWEGRSRYSGRTYDEVERDLQRDYQRNRGNSQLEWKKNRHAVRAAWDRFDATDDFENSQ